MATFAVRDGNTTDIDPELLTVNLLGPEPDPEDLVITPQNVKMTDSDQIADISDDNSDDNESIDRILEAQKPSPKILTDDEKEISAVEDMLRSKKSARIKKQKEEKLPENSHEASSKRKIDPIVVVSAVVAAALIFVFAAYFMGLFDGSNSLKMTLSEFSGSYSKTAAYKSATYYTISPASLWFTKQYPLEKWVEFISYIPAQTKIYFLGSPNDNILCEEIIRRSGHQGCVDLSGKLSFLESASLMKDARMNFTNDSAPMHLASAMNAPVTVIYCSTVPRFGFGPLSDDSKIVEIAGELYCRPCGIHGYRSCPEKHFRCATQIDVDQLISRL